MELHEWWAGDPSERFWLEITDREDLGTNLWAPQLDDGGRPTWSYELVTAVRPGDIVLHWTKQGDKSVVAYSHVTGVPHASTIVWQSHGTYGRQKALPTTPRPAWEAPLGGLTPLATPVSLERVREEEAVLRAIRQDLEAEHGAPIYFPFALSNSRPVRAAQAYLTKFPARLVEAFPELAEVRQLAAAEPSEEVAPSPPPTRKTSEGRQKSRPSGYGRQQDVLRRRAVELHAVETVMSSFAARGWTVDNVGDSSSWDITAVRGLETLHIEVKGSTMARAAIDVTEGEVRHAEDSPTLLVVIDRIQVDGSGVCSGGVWREWVDWVPDREALVPTAYRYPLP